MLAIIGKIGTAGGTGYAMEFGGEAVRSLSMEVHDALQHGDRGRCPCRHGRLRRSDRGLREGPSVRAEDQRAVGCCDQILAHLKSDDDAAFDRTVVIDASLLIPYVTWGTSPEMVITVDERVPILTARRDSVKREGIARALAYMGLTPKYTGERDQDRQAVHWLLHQLAHRRL